MMELRGVRVHNLKGIDLDLPYGKLIAVCGRSGSGKSSLALDTLFAEGQRRYIETFSAYARQFLARWERPDADRLDGIPAAIAVRGTPSNPSSRSTVGSATEIDDYLQLLFAKIGTIYCPGCGKPVRCDTPQTILKQLKQSSETKIQISIAPPLDISRNIFETTWKERGFVRGSIFGEPFRLDDGGVPDASYRRILETKSKANASLLDGIEQGSDPQLFLTVDRIVVGQTEDRRIVDSLESAMQYGNGKCFVGNLPFSTRLNCESCDISFDAPDPKLLRNANPSGDLHTRLLRDVVRVDGKTLADIDATKISATKIFFDSLRISEPEMFVGGIPLEQIRKRLGFLEQVGLGYLTLSRPMTTLGNGERRRVELTTVLGSSLVDMLYVLDEPSIGLHPKDSEILLRSVKSLRDRGNSVIVVEHDEAFLHAADRIVEIGPEAGENGGRIVFQGTPQELLAAPESPTGRFLSEKRDPKKPPKRRKPEFGFIELRGGTGNNLQRINVSFPLGVLCLVTGVSGAGKSTLVQETLYPALCERLAKKSEVPLPFEKLTGEDRIDDVILVDQSPIGRSGRSNPVTYLKIFDEIRNVFAETPDARIRNFTAGHFSFNVAGGRCETCKGDGSVTVDMQFLPDMFLRCPDCNGKRYRPEILDILYRGKNIADVLDLTIREAFSFFRGQAKVQQRLKRLMDVGLDYLRLGQPANTLSGGESQRLKLAAFLSTGGKGHCLFLMDEPTTGLHFADVAQLLDCFESLLDTGHSLIIVEHNTQMMHAADYIIDLGPGAAENGGRIVAQGTPEEVAANTDSATGAALSLV